MPDDFKKDTAVMPAAAAAPVQLYHLVCVHDFDGYVRGQRVTDAAEVEKMMADRDHHFVRVSAV